MVMESISRIMRTITMILMMILAFILMFYQDDFGRVGLCLAFLMGFLLDNVKSGKDEK